MKRQRLYCFPYFVQNTDIHLSGNRWNSTIDEKLEVNYLYNEWTTSCFLSCLNSHLVKQQFVFNIEINRYFFRKIGTIIRSSHDSKWQACMRGTDADRAWQAGRGKPWTQHAKTFSDEMYKEDPTQDIPDWLQPVTVNLEDLEKCARRFLWKSEHRFGRWRYKSGDTKTEAQYSCLLPQIPKEIYSTNRRDWWLDNSGAQNPQRRMWISVQSPVRCRGTKSHHSVDITRVKTELHRRRRRIFMEVPRAVAETRSYSYGRLWRIITEAISHRLETWNCRTSCTSSKRRDISVLLQSGLNEEWWSDSMKCFYYLQNVQNLLANGKSQIWTKIWGIIQRINCTIWRTGWMSPRTPRKIKARIHHFGKKIFTRNCHWFCLFPGWESGKKIFQLLRLKNLEIWRHWKIFQKTECEGSSENPKRWRICISCSRSFTKNIREKLQIPRTHSETGIRRKKREYQRRISRRWGRVSTWRIKKMTKESTRFSWLTQKLGKNFTYRHHIEPRSSIARAEKRTYPIRLDFFWCHQVNLCRSRGCARKANLCLLGCRREQKFVNIVNEFHKIYVIEWNSSEKV